jgi:AraC family transcriptional regulator
MTREESIKEYYFRINKSIDYIKDQLHEDLSLDKLAGLSNFSKFHFHRIFKSVTGTALNDFIVRARIERALFYLSNYPTKPIREIALECGFKDAATFSRSFKTHKQISAQQWRLDYQHSKICQADSNEGHATPTIENYLAHKLLQMEIRNKGREVPTNIQISELQPLQVAYVRNLDVHIHDSETFAKMFDLLFEWAAPKRLINFPESKALTVYRSNPNLSGHIQADVCLTVPEGTIGEGLIGTTTISGGLYAVVHKEASLEECFTTWDYIFDVWFEQNGYQPDHRNFYINHLNDAKAHPQNLHIFDMCIPIKPL